MVQYRGNPGTEEEGLTLTVYVSVTSREWLTHLLTRPLTAQGMSLSVTLPVPKLPLFLSITVPVRQGTTLSPFG